ncbi:hypothetical protein GUY44_27140 [Pimelobacter simplex]|uniref:hypothetical protein n=1 Tax=Nocardioides simplex TaxID=2045 RepID=UPI0008E6F0FB|nr:hypothetical protein [Pimelobacter simplex]MCG8154178.1 hypothetical protein [Pimelobacter simplex]GEB15586.1 hypothetical protein NSI01_39010 [Pimelobacter simplex]SFM57964.1 hypothetical protein SAMN05421671_2500 [Pimelobacter simplex]
MTRPRSISRWATVALSCLALASALAACSAPSDEASDSTSPASVPASSAPTAPPADPVDTAVRDAYRAATGESVPTWAPEIAIHVGGRLAGRITAAEASAGSSWDACPQGEQEYAGRPCPVGPAAALNALLADGGAPTATEGAPAVVGCDKPERPRVAGAVDSVSIVPDQQHQDCFAAFSWTLYLNGEDEIVATDLVLSSP